MVPTVCWILAAFAGIVYSQIASPGECPNLPTQSPFNPAAFISARTWYVISRYPSAIEEGTRCSYIDVRPSRNGPLKFSFKGISLGDGSPTNAAGDGYFAYGALSKFQLTVPINSWNSEVGFLFSIMATDYRNFALAWSCDPLCAGFKRENLWLLSRQRTLSPELMEQVTKIHFGSGSHFKADQLVRVNQTDCPPVATIKNYESDSFFLFGAN